MHACWSFSLLLLLVEASQNNGGFNDQGRRWKKKDDDYHARRQERHQEGYRQNEPRFRSNLHTTLATSSTPPPPPPQVHPPSSYLSSLTSRSVPSSGEKVASNPRLSASLNPAYHHPSPVAYVPMMPTDQYMQRVAEMNELSVRELRSHLENMHLGGQGYAHNPQLQPIPASYPSSLYPTASNVYPPPFATAPPPPKALYFPPPQTSMVGSKKKKPAQTGYVPPIKLPLSVEAFAKQTDDLLSLLETELPPQSIPLGQVAKIGSIVWEKRAPQLNLNVQSSNAKEMTLARSSGSSGEESPGDSDGAMESETESMLSASHSSLGTLSPSDLDEPASSDGASTGPHSPRPNSDPSSSPSPSPSPSPAIARPVRESNPSSSRASSNSVASSSKPELCKEKPFWLKHKPDEPANPIDRLTSELESFVAWLETSPEEKKARQKAIDAVSALIFAKGGSKLSVTVYGSHLTGLGLPMGDVDIAIQETESPQPNRMQYLANALKLELGKRGAVKLIPDGTLIEMIHPPTGIPFDLTIKDPALPLAVAEQVKLSLETEPLIRPLCLVIKWFLRQHNLNIPFTGGFSSYTVYLLVRFYLQARKRITGGPYYPSSKGDSLGAHFMGLLYFYGHGVFDRENALIQVEGEGKVSWKDESILHDPYQRDRLCLQDPLDAKNNVSRMSFADYQIFTLFRSTYDLLADKVLPDYVEWYAQEEAKRQLKKNKRLGPDRFTGTFIDPDILITSIFLVPEEIKEKRKLLAFYR